VTSDMEDLSKVCSLKYADAKRLQCDSNPFIGKISRRSEFMKLLSDASFTVDVRSSRLAIPSTAFLFW
jgi:hypothetical protein